MPERIRTLHPAGRGTSVLLRRDRYEAAREAIVEALRHRAPLSFDELVDAVRDRLDVGPLCTVRWYVRTVKLDLEARGVLRCVPHRRPQQVHLV